MPNLTPTEHKLISIVVPCYQSAGNLIGLLEDIKKAVANIRQVSFELLFVDDGSTDNTYEELKQVLEDKSIPSSIIKLSRNFGSYNAFYAGIVHAKGDAIIHLHADGEDPPELIPEMVKYWQQNTKLVIAYRTGREDLLLQKPISNLYHKIMNSMMIRKVPLGGFDLILFDRQLADIIIHSKEKNTNLVYQIAWLGFPFVSIPYKRHKRKHGVSQWTFPKQIKLTIDSIMSFSFAPVRYIWYTGILSLVAGSIFAIGNLCGHYFISTIGALMLLCTGIILIALGVVGEYVWRVLEQSKNRPTFVVDTIETNADQVKPE